MSIRGWVMEKLRVPPLLQRVKLDAETCGVDFSIRTSPRYTVVTVEGQELFFDRETGRYDGFGGMQLDPTSCRRAGDFGSSPPGVRD